MPDDVVRTSPETGAMPEPTAPDLEKVVARAQRNLRRMANYRRPFDAKRLSLYRQFLAQRDPLLYPDNVTQRSSTSVPYALSNVQTVKSRTLDAFFSFDPWFEVRGRGATDEPRAENMQRVLHYLLSRAEFVKAFETLVDNILIYGHSAVKVDWDWGYETVTYPEPIFATDPETGGPAIDPNTGQPVILGFRPQTRQIPRMCPKFIPIDIYDLLVDPDAQHVAHMTERTFGDLLREVEMRPDYYFPEGIEKLTKALAKEDNPEAIVIRMAEIWDTVEDTVTLMTSGIDVEGIQWKDSRASFRNSGYTPYRRRVFGGEAILLWHGPNQFMHKRTPILHTSYIKLPNEVYGLGAIEPISRLSNSLDNFVNMIADNWNLGINRRYAYDVNADIDHEALNNFNVPGGKVGVVGDPSKVVMPLPFFTPNANDYQILGLYRQMIEMTSGVSDFYAKGVGTSGANDTATGIASIVNETNFKFRMFIRNLELDILQPLLKMCASMVQQFITDDFEVLITDQPPTIPKFPLVRPEDLIGTFDFELVAANYTSNKFVRQRNLLAFANWASQSPFWNPHEGLKEIAKVFEIRNAHKLLKTPEQVMMEQQAALDQQIRMMLLEHALDTEQKTRVAQSRAKVSGKAEGRPRSVQLEGAIPGAGLSSEIRELAQSMGLNGVGLSGMGEGGGG